MSDLTKEEFNDLLKRVGYFEEGYNDEWTDFMDMVNDIRKYREENGGEIDNFDKPMELKIGYICMKTDKTWSIGIVKMRKCFDAMEGGKGDILRLAFQTIEGRNNLLKILNGL